jgi:trehalose synthase
VVQKSLVEGFGLTVTEAMWKSRPVVASRVGGIQDQIRHEREGLLVDDPTDLATFAAAVNRLLADPSVAGRLGVAACIRAVEEFVGDCHLTRYADVLLGLIVDRRRHWGRSSCWARAEGPAGRDLGPWLAHIRRASVRWWR